MESAMEKSKGVVFVDTPDCLDEILKIAPNGFSVNYNDKNHPVMKIDGKEYHVGDYIDVEGR
ncbi:MAG: hypothetical protein RSC06_00840 [Clostridia bacterium]